MFILVSVVDVNRSVSKKMERVGTRRGGEMGRRKESKLERPVS